MPQLKNSKAQYGIIAKAFHWLSAIVVIGLFGVGWWMVDLNYYSQWYQTAPHWHKSIGILLLIATLTRLVWKALTPSPSPLATQSPVEQKAAKFAHYLLYALMLVIMLSGYLISTADGRAIAVFNWFEVAALGELFSNQADIAGVVHEYLAYTLILLALLHALAALKHHFVDKDDTLRRML
ncbi:cytochrome b [Thalassotalea euphylliae]|uniref:Cytochrome b n=1 Tax=Thalassotalea euphylliae TaxID=1655234 RepID=A0A3E0TPD1_9GAMM|nr:cytochrome b [Thalassotalea euphylliae]REL25932.1 cytochrome b [Thalassotalea euphylliae]